MRILAILDGTCGCNRAVLKKTKKNGHQIFPVNRFQEENR